MLSKGLDQLDVVRELGRGAMGVVYEARDGRTGEAVALKVLLRQTASDEVELKREFRRLRGVQHPNLVQLGQLGVTEHGIGFTMELVHGADLVSWCAGCDADEVCRAFGQLALGLHALHGSDLLHQDIKPGNVLVESDGRVVVVDFGLSTLTRVANRSSPGGGTYAFMAPEQAWARPIDDAADWFAFGGLLFLVLTGESPPRVGMYAADSARMSLLDDVPSPARKLADLCRALLVEEPGDRPGFQVIAHALDVKPAVSAWVQASPGEFVGRNRELSTLEASLDHARSGELSVVSVVGPSGIGKSALIDAFVEQSVADHELLLLRAQCHPQDAVPFNGMDELVDGLAEFLLGLPMAERQGLAAEAMVHAASVFTGFRPLVNTSVDGSDVSARTVGVAADAVQCIVDWVSTQRTIAVWMDDIQWADADSLALLQRVFRRGRGNVLLLLGARTLPSTLHDWLSDVQAKSIHLGGLPDADVLALLRDRVSEPELVDRIVQTAEGSPFAVTELARYVTANGRGISSNEDIISQAIRWRVEEHGNEAARLVTHVAVCGGPAPSRMLAALGLADAQLLQRMADQCFLQIDPITGAVRTYHDTVRRAIVAAVPESDLARIHTSLASGLDELGSVDPALTSEHYEAAGNLSRALVLARDAASGARARGAFERAARQYERVLRLTSTCDAETAARCADCWASAGRSDPAAHWYSRARQWSQASERAVDLYRLEAEHYLRAGDVERGTTAFREVFSALGLRYL